MQRLIDASKMYLPIGVVITAIVAVFVAGGFYRDMTNDIKSLQVNAQEVKEVLKDTPTRVEWTDLKTKVDEYQKENRDNTKMIMQYLQKR